MFRYRRYRVFVVFAVITIFALYKFGRSSTAWRDAASTAAELKSEAEDALGFGHKPKPALAHDTKKLEVHIPAASRSQSLQSPPPVKVFSTPSPPSPPPATRPPQQKPSVPTPTRPRPHARPPPVDAGYDVSSIAPIHWTKLPEKFPVPTESLIKLPAGKSKAIPKIQAKFAPEDDIAKANRLNKLGTIKTVFRRSWEGYREYAWEHDELKPESGTFRDPFAGWRATLVDALDTLWIMGLKEEFEEAVKAVAELDFTTTSRADIPLFETTIRYLGGLLAAYDVSGAKYDTLLEKAKELAEVLISAFDTPNRMPETYYYWRPQFASQQHRAPIRAVLAEIGSLSMEFTRLAQLTGEHKYYDAIARITDELEDFQNNTRLPGMWPTYMDVSGCGKPVIEIPVQAPLLNPDPIVIAPAASSATEILSPNGHKFVPLDKPQPVVFKPATGVTPLQTTSQSPSPIIAVPKPGPNDLSPGGNKFVPLVKPDPVVLKPANEAKHAATESSGAAVVRDWNGHPLEKRQLEVDPEEQPPVAAQRQNSKPLAADSLVASTPKLPECVSQGFKSTSEYGREEYTLGGMSDSTYEYLPKQYLLLGGQVEKYRKMYEDSADVVKKHLIFRPMLPNNDDVLMCGKLDVPSLAHNGKAGDLTGENAHLTCFAGGMFGMAAKMFDRTEDLEIAKKLTEGCVLSYSMTPSGIMPESFEVLPCDDVKECSWNETLYWDTLDPQAEYRATTYKEQIQLYRSQIASASSWYEAQLAAMTASPTPEAAFPSLAAMPTLANKPYKRQLVDLADDAEVAASIPTPLVPERGPSIANEDDKYYVDSTPSRTYDTEGDEDVAPIPSRVLPAFPYVYSPSVPLNHKDFVQSRIQEERLPPGMTKIGSRDYILRPEAIESVWYMYRITGDNHWREAGWRMFKAIEEHTAAKYGNSAIDDVTKLIPTKKDEMESFWLAETLKYFYLLFEEEDKISLDEWVLNTEAHPFKRAK